MISGFRAVAGGAGFLVNTRAPNSQLTFSSLQILQFPILCLHPQQPLWLVHPSLARRPTCLLHIVSWWAHLYPTVHSVTMGMFIHSAFHISDLVSLNVLQNNIFSIFPFGWLSAPTSFPLSWCRALMAVGILPFHPIAFPLSLYPWVPSTSHLDKHTQQQEARTHSELWHLSPILSSAIHFLAITFDFMAE